MYPVSAHFLHQSSQRSISARDISVNLVVRALSPQESVTTASDLRPSDAEAIPAYKDVNEDPIPASPLQRLLPPISLLLFVSWMLFATLLRFVVTLLQRILLRCAWKIQASRNDVEALGALNDNGTPWSESGPSNTSARSHQLPRVRYALVLETGGTFARMAPQEIMWSFVREHNNPNLAELFRDNLVGRNLSFKV